MRILQLGVGSVGEVIADCRARARVSATRNVAPERVNLSADFLC